jgi:hypothetical protein
MFGSSVILLMVAILFLKIRSSDAPRDAAEDLAGPVIPEDFRPRVPAKCVRLLWPFCRSRSHQTTRRGTTSTASADQNRGAVRLNLPCWTTRPRSLSADVDEMQHMLLLGLRQGHGAEKPPTNLAELLEIRRRRIDRHTIDLKIRKSDIATVEGH